MVLVIPKLLAAIVTPPLCAVLHHVVIEGGKRSKAAPADRAAIVWLVVFVFIAEHGAEG